VSGVDDDLFGFDEIRRLAVLVNAAHEVARACSQRAASRDEREVEGAPAREAGRDRDEAVHDRHGELLEFGAVEKLAECVPVPEEPEHTK